MNQILEPEYVGLEGAPDDNLETLPQKQQIAIIQINAPQRIKTISDIKTWVDDKEVCVSAKINGIELPFWWSGASLVGHLMYSNVVPGAKQQVFEWIQEKIQTAYEEYEDFSNLVDKVRENEEVKANVRAKVGSDLPGNFDKLIDNIL